VGGVVAGTSGRDDLGNDAGRRRIRRPTTRATVPGGTSTGAGREPVEKRYEGRLPVSGQETDADKMKMAAQQPWDCACGRQNRYYVFRCRTCGAKRPW
jgi:hypothetical protein